jgi:uncharacterized protein (DUF849 family)
MAYEHYAEVVDRIRQQNTDVIINLTTGLGAASRWARTTRSC